MMSLHGNEADCRPTYFHLPTHEYALFDKSGRFSPHSSVANEPFKRSMFTATGMPWLERARTA